MKINSSFKTNESSKNVQSFKGVPANPVILPEFVGKIGKIAGETIRTPEQKLLLALGALFIQPLIDLKFADEDKKHDAAIKSASKAIAGGLTGVTIRAVAQTIMNNVIGPEKTNSFNALIFPKKYIKYAQDHPELAEFKIQEYRKNVATIFALLFMLFFSNSKVDVPLTSDLQDLISGVVKEDKTWLKSLTDVYTSRKEKINKWISKRKSKLDNIKNKLIKIIHIIREKPVTPIKEDNNESS